jgi:hypothetical protein
MLEEGVGPLGDFWAREGYASAGIDPFERFFYVPMSDGAGVQRFSRNSSRSIPSGFSLAKHLSSEWHGNRWLNAGWLFLSNMIPVCPGSWR